jgi:hypothetical protein
LKSGRVRRRARGNAAQVEEAVANVAILCQVGRSSCFAGCGHHLVEGPAIWELRIKLAAEFARAAGAGIKTSHDGRIDVFHEDFLLEA